MTSSQDRVTGGMSERVVDPLKEVDISQKQSHRTPSPDRSAQLATQGIEDGAAVEHSGQCIVSCLNSKRLPGGDQLRVQCQSPRADVQSGSQFHGFKGLTQIIVRSALQSAGNLFLTRSRSQKDAIDVAVGRERADEPAHLDTVQPGHLAVYDCQARTAFGFEHSPRRHAIASRRRNGVTPAPEGSLPASGVSPLRLPRSEPARTALRVSATGRTPRRSPTIKSCVINRAGEVAAGDSGREM